MRTHSEVIREVTLSPGEYCITRHDYGVDLIEVIGGKLQGQAFPVWCSWQVSLSRAGNYPLVLTWRRERNWKTLWLFWIYFITVSDGTSEVLELVHRSFAHPRL